MTLPTLKIVIDAGPDAPAEELDQASRQLRDELLELDEVTVDHAAAVSPSGSKGPGGVDVGTLVLTLSNSAVLVTLAGVLRSWVGRASGRKVTVRMGEDSIEIDGASREDVTALLRSWAAKHEQR